MSKNIRRSQTFSSRRFFNYVNTRLPAPDGAADGGQARLPPARHASRVEAGGSSTAQAVGGQVYVYIGSLCPTTLTILSVT